MAGFAVKSVVKKSVGVSQGPALVQHLRSFSVATALQSASLSGIYTRVENSHSVRTALDVAKTYGFSSPSTFSADNSSKLIGAKFVHDNSLSLAKSFENAPFAFTTSDTVLPRSLAFSNVNAALYALSDAFPEKKLSFLSSHSSMTKLIKAPEATLVPLDSSDKDTVVIIKHGDDVMGKKALIAKASGLVIIVNSVEERDSLLQQLNDVPVRKSILVNCDDGSAVLESKTDDEHVKLFCARKDNGLVLQPSSARFASKVKDHELEKALHRQLFSPFDSANTVSYNSGMTGVLLAKSLFLEEGKVAVFHDEGYGCTLENVKNDTRCDLLNLHSPMISYDKPFDQVSLVFIERLPNPSCKDFLGKTELERLCDTFPNAQIVIDDTFTYSVGSNNDMWSELSSYSLEKVNIMHSATKYTVGAVLNDTTGFMMFNSPQKAAEAREIVNLLNLNLHPEVLKSANDVVMPTFERRTSSILDANKRLSAALQTIPDLKVNNKYNARSFSVEMPEEFVERFMDILVKHNLGIHAVSLGAEQTTIMNSSKTTHSGVADMVSSGLVRINCGSDVAADLDQHLEPCLNELKSLFRER